MKVAADKVKALKVEVVASAGLAAAGDNDPANILVLVTDPESGLPVTGLLQDNFIVVDHFTLPLQNCGFSGNIVSFFDIHSGAYQLKVQNHATGPCSGWVSGDYLAQVYVADPPPPTSPKEAGQGAAVLHIN